MFNTVSRYIFGSFLLVLVAAQTAVARGNLPEFTQLVEDNAPAVVNISTTQKVKKRRQSNDLQLPENSPFDDLFRHFFDQMPENGGDLLEREAQSLGSGFIISKDGFILTNHHVVDDADEIIVRLSDRQTYEAEVIGSDAASDIAVLKIEAKDLPTVSIGKSHDLKVGEWVLAIGSPFGFDHTVTAGIVSAKGRSLPTENYVPYIQTDVAINPGNSGGPLFNLDGEVVGINSQIYSRTGGFMGLSFAIPIELALNVAKQIQETGHVARGYIGVLIQDVTHNLAESFGMKHPKGALVSRVIDDSPASEAGLEVGDVILEYNNHKLQRSSQLPPLVGATEIGQRVPLKVLRNGKQITIKMKIGALPDSKTLAQSSRKAPAESKSNRLGLVVGDLNATTREKLGAPEGAGVIVQRVDEGVAQSGGVRKGDIILMLDGKKMNSASQFDDYLGDLPDGKSIAVLLHRKEGPIFIALKLPR
ncbi:MAG: DegQ family serine endoprotease [bacterium]